MEKEKIILGIDPGTTVMGYAVLSCKGNKTQVITLGVLELHKLGDHYLKLQRIFQRLIQLIDEYHPDELSIEAPFFGKNVQSMLKLGRAQGVAIAAALSRSIPIFEYAPRKIKMSITGSGNATKEQVAEMLHRSLKFDDIIKFLDATDALAAAVCHFYQKDFSTTPKKVKQAASSWNAFINKNPGRIKKP